MYGNRNLREEGKVEKNHRLKSRDETDESRVQTRATGDCSSESLSKADDWRLIFAAVDCLRTRFVFLNTSPSFANNPNSLKGHGTSCKVAPV